MILPVISIEISSSAPPVTRVFGGRSVVRAAALESYAGPRIFLVSSEFCTPGQAGARRLVASARLSSSYLCLRYCQGPNLYQQQHRRVFGTTRREMRRVARCVAKTLPSATLARSAAIDRVQTRGPMLATPGSRSLDNRAREERGSRWPRKRMASTTAGARRRR